MVTPATWPGAKATGGVSVGSGRVACERCGASSSRTVPLVEGDMSVGHHRLCEGCWTRLLAGLSQQRPWLHVGDDPEALYVPAELAWTLLGATAET